MKISFRRRGIASLLMWATVFISDIVSIAVYGGAEPIATCNTTGCIIGNAYGYWPDRVPCHAASVIYPKTEQEIIQAVADAGKRNLKIKVGSKYSHSMCKLVCPGGDHGIFLSTRDYNSVESIDKIFKTVTAQAGIQLHDLISIIADSGLVLRNAPYWDGLSLGGLLGTGAHGSSLWGKGSAIHEYVVGMRLVVPAPSSQGYAKVVTLKDNDADLKAARLSLGVLGVISTITLELEPLFKRSVSHEIEDDAGLEDNVFKFSRKYEFGDVRWFPSQHKVMYRVDKRVPLSTPGHGFNTRFRGSAGLDIEAARAQEDRAEASKDETRKCSLAKSLLTSAIRSGGGFSNNFTTFTGYPVVGFQNDMQTSSGCQNSPTISKQKGIYCSWDRQVRGRNYFESSTYMALRSLRSFVKDVKSLREKVPGSLCNVDAYDSGILMRFIKKSERAYLGAVEDVAEVNFDYYRAYEARTPKLDEDVIEELEQICLHKYNAKPHWGKNRNVAFEGVAKTYPKIKKFLDVKRKYDPRGLFSSEWSDAILGINKKDAPSVTILKPYCALEGLCICNKDIHCAPEKNYFCRPGRIFSKARVCRQEAH